MAGGNRGTLPAVGQKVGREKDEAEVSGGGIELSRDVPAAALKVAKGPVAVPALVAGVPEYYRSVAVTTEMMAISRLLRRDDLRALQRGTLFLPLNPV